jgi:dual specificity protein phosphatase 1B
MAAECEPAFPDCGIEYLHLPALDRPDFALRARYFSPAVAFLSSVKDRYESGEDVAVLVHCYAGLSRSVATVIAFLVADRGMSLDAALALVRRCRNGASPDNFMAQLVEWEAEIRDSAAESPTRVSSAVHHPPRQQLVLPKPLQQTPELSPA